MLQNILPCKGKTDRLTINEEIHITSMLHNNESTLYVLVLVSVFSVDPLFCPSVTPNYFNGSRDESKVVGFFIFSQ